jgi:2-haloacid dehalogenase
MTMVHVFDAYGTLLDPHAPLRAHAAALGPKLDAVSAHARAKLLEYTWVRTLGGFPWRDFRALTEDGLRHALAVHGVALSEADIADAMARYDALQPFPEVPDTLRRLRAGGGRLAILSNGTEGMLAAALSASGLADLFEAVVSVDALARFKTAPEVYALGFSRLGVAPGEVAFYSSNRWDVAAARNAGCHAVWVNRAGAVDEYADLPPHRVVRSLAEAG